jgi:hypothetical protein
MVSIGVLPLNDVEWQRNRIHLRRFVWDKLLSAPFPRGNGRTCILQHGLA